MAYKIIALVIIAILIVTNYAMLVVASRADERANRMYRAWKEKCNERSNNQADK